MWWFWIGAGLFLVGILAAWAGTLDKGFSPLVRRLLLYGGSLTVLAAFALFIFSAGQ
jgi:hypothetical protein